MKIWLIQNIISPYRIKLFQTMSETMDVEFKLILLSKGLKYMPQWKFNPEDMPFEAERVEGIVFYTGYENQICINPLLFIKMIREKPDVIICAGFSFATLISLIYKLIFRGRYIIWMEGTQFTEANLSKLRRTMRKIMARFASGFVDAGTMSGKYLETLLPKQHSKPFFRSYNCVESKKFEDNADGEELKIFRKRYCDRNILFVGQLVERKGIIQILETYKELVKKYRGSVGLILLGDGPMKGYVEDFKEKHKGDNIFIEGFLNNDELGKYYGLCDLFMLLSLRDPNPLVIVEAMTAGIPIVCSNRAGNAVDFIVDGKNGYIVDPYNIDEITLKAISTMEWKNREEIKIFSRELVKKANYSDSAKAFIEACCFAVK